MNNGAINEKSLSRINTNFTYEESCIVFGIDQDKL